MARPFRKLMIRIHPAAKQQYETMRGSETFLLIGNKLQYLRIDPLRGVPVTRSQIPQRYKELDVNNLFKITIDDALHAIYTVGSNEKEITALVLEFLNNGQFNEIFADVDFGEEREAVGTTDVE